MRPTEEQDNLEKAKAEQIIAETPLMEGIESVSVELGDDHDGDPSMWLVFNLEPDFRPKHNFEADKQWFERFHDYSGRIDTKIIHSGLTRFPYTRLRRAA